jgi:hypothetical protein
MNTTRIIRLTPPRISPAHIREKITCIRAHRERIFHVSVELIDGKLICHNYGQGGAGWTFLFGCVNEAMRLFDDQLQRNPSLAHKSITVLGAGCYGLLTALLLARRGHTVRIVAAQVDQVSSHNAAGFFFPRPRKSSTPGERAIFEALGIESYTAYQQIIKGTHPFIRTGAAALPCYFGPDIDPGFAPYIARGLMPHPEAVTIDFGNGTTYPTICYQTIFMHASILMEELHRGVRELQIPMAQATMTTFSEIPEAIIFNCTGLGSRTLTSDTRIIPVQGHLITLRDQPPAHELQYMINVKVVMTDVFGKKRDELIYYAPKNEGILGITFKRGHDSLTANAHEFERLLQRCQEFFGNPSTLLS